MCESKSLRQKRRSRPSARKRVERAHGGRRRCDSSRAKEAPSPGTHFPGHARETPLAGETAPRRLRATRTLPPMAKRQCPRTLRDSYGRFQTPGREARLCSWGAERPSCCGLQERAGESRSDASTGLAAASRVRVARRDRRERVRRPDCRPARSLLFPVPCLLVPLFPFSSFPLFLLPGPCCYPMYMPPFTSSTWPVMYDAASEARNFTASATSCGVPFRPRGIVASIALV